MSTFATIFDLIQSLHINVKTGAIKLGLKPGVEGPTDYMVYGMYPETNRFEAVPTYRGVTPKDLKRYRQVRSQGTPEDDNPKITLEYEDEVVQVRLDRIEDILYQVFAYDFCARITEYTYESRPVKIAQMWIPHPDPLDEPTSTLVALIGEQELSYEWHNLSTARDVLPARIRHRLTCLDALHHNPDLYESYGIPLCEMLTGARRRSWSTPTVRDVYGCGSSLKNG